MSAPTVEPGVTVDVDLGLPVPCEYGREVKCGQPAAWLGTLACDSHHRCAYCPKHRADMDYAASVSSLRVWLAVVCNVHGFRPILPIRWVPL